MTEDKKPIMNIGLFTAPVVIPNFSTDEEGHNIIAEKMLGLFATILDETWTKLHDMTHQMMDEIGVEVQTIPNETLREIISQVLSKQEAKDGTMRGVLTQKGKVILDEQAAEQLRKGISINN